MKTSIATVTLAGELPEKLSAIAAAGFDGIEIFEQDFIAYDGTPREVGQHVRDHGLDIMLFQPFRDFEGLPEPERTRAFERAKCKFDVMGELGVDLMLVCSSLHPKVIGGIDRAADDLHALGELASQHGVRIGYEALAWGAYVNDHRDAWEIVRRADHDHVGLIVDSFHTLGRSLSPDSIRSIPGDKIFFVQLADAPLITMDLLYWSRHFRNMPGEGDLDVTAFMRAVMATGYNGPISLEIFNDSFRGGNPDMIARDGYRSLRAIMDDVHRSEPITCMPLPAMPPRPIIQGVEFVEFAASQTGADTLAAILLPMGFTRAVHKNNQNIILFQQGDTRIIVNTSHHDSAALADGAKVCDIGLHIDNADNAITRAKELRVPLFTSPLLSGELSLPAIQSVGGTIIHFIEADSKHQIKWHDDFIACTPAEPEDCNITGIDHLALSMPYSDMLSWSLFYTSLFEVQKHPIVDVIDPAGVIRSQVIESSDKSFRLTLNGSDTNRTLAGYFVESNAGSAVQHIALTTSDIFSIAEKLAGTGFETLAIPANYYDDIRARFGFDETALSAIKQFNILYDEDENGAFYQLYSVPYGDGFFFEIIQRVDGYQGYGAANAPYRTAALKRVLSQKNAPAR